MTIRKTPTILVVEDDVENRTAMVKVLEGAEYKVLETDNGQQALDLLNEEDIDILVTDLRLPVMDGVELLKRAKAVEQDIEVIMITGHGTVEIAVEAIKEGAYDFITKPVKKAQLLRAVEKAAEKQYLSRENRELAPAVEPERRPTHRLRQRRNAKYRAHGRAGCAEHGDGSDHRRKRNRQGSDRRCDSFRFTAPAQADDQSQLRGACRIRFSNPNCSDMRRAPSPARMPARKADSNWPTAARCFSMRSARSVRPFR